MWMLYLGTGVLLGVSAVINPKRTLKALKISLKRFLKIAPSFLIMLILVSIALFLFPEERITNLLSKGNIWIATLMGSIVGSISLMPGFVAYPLCGILRDNGIPYMVLSGFSTTLMMVGVLTFPIEKTYLGTRTVIIRNVIGFITALIIALATGMLFGEVSLW
ncbi:MAG: hypothetical protein H8D05_01035 [FCB group bacterium]|nr:hypothetical protein [FCB group bacterium]